MKKRVLALLMCTTMAFALLTGCGSKEEAPAEKEAVEEEAEEEEAEEEEAEDEEAEDEEEVEEEEYEEEEAEEVADYCSDESFAALQEAYGYLTEEYNTVEDFYKSNDSIPQNDDVEEALTTAKDYLDQVGAIEQTEITEDDALTLVNSMQDVAEGLAMIAEGLAEMAQ